MLHVQNDDDDNDMMILYKTLQIIFDDNSTES